MNRFTNLFAGLCLSMSIACAGSGDAGDVCQQAADLAEECTGTAAEYPVEGCVGEYRASAEEIVEEGCAAFESGGKSDGWFCNSFTRWLGVCEAIVPLEEAAAVEGLDDVCPASRSDELCFLLHQADEMADLVLDDETAPEEAAYIYRQAADEIAARLSSEPREQVLTDPAVRYFIRERAVSLVAWNVVTQRGRRIIVEGTYPAEVDSVLETHYPAYDPADFKMAHISSPPPSPDKCTETQALMFYPGVVRLMDREEFAEQSEALTEALPCLVPYRVESGSFVSPSLNAAQGKMVFDRIQEELGDVPVHLLGYSQGSMNSLTTLVEFPEIAARAASVMTLNSAARGSEVGDTGFAVLSKLQEGIDNVCGALPDFMKPLCDFAASQSPRPTQFVLELLAKAMAVPLEQLQAFVEAEDGVSEAPDLEAFFLRHMPGFRSLTTTEAGGFWASRAQDLPRNTLYISFRSIVTDKDANLPDSNALFFALLERAGGESPYNDMQVRLENQRLGGPVADLEVRSPVAEGNHWQWELATGAVPENTMPAEMTDKTPHRELLVGYYQALLEVGLIR